MEQSVHRPLSQSVFWLDRRVNSAIRERGRLDLLRRPRAPVVTDCYIDPSTRPHPNAYCLYIANASSRQSCLLPLQYSRITIEELSQSA